MVVKAHNQKIPKTICVIAIICSSLVLSYISFFNLPKSFAQRSSSDLSATQKSASTDRTCALASTSIRLKGTPQQTEGPYFVDGMPDRSDIRSDPSDATIQQGIPLHLIIRVFDVDNGSCIPLKGARVDIWHANSQGIYSAVNDLGTIGKKFLRGY
ncbi:MAG: hypothetical protein WBZ36_26865, partial [Candidatus Nitrosopolaris sp.]